VTAGIFNDDLITQSPFLDDFLKGGKDFFTSIGAASGALAEINGRLAGISLIQDRLAPLLKGRQAAYPFHNVSFPEFIAGFGPSPRPFLNLSVFIQDRFQPSGIHLAVVVFIDHHDR
jgi:hypothetical protein